MAGRFLPQRDVDLITRVSRELVGDKQGNKDGLINQECVVYKPSLQESAVNMYGEAAGGKKVYKNGVQMNALVSADDFDFNTDEFGPDAQQNVTFSFIRQAFIDASMVLEIGDLIDWNYGYFEVGSINENQLIGGQFNQNFSVVATTFLIRKSSIQIERVRSI
jgi:hypothetical protein|tara:strand:+ start:758 stop:1246 length:489 start_codon:yes stop_codon:yes gene_type:complete